MRWFQHDLTGLAFCWRLTRQDGVRLGFTSHDRDMWAEGQLYRATPGLVPSALETGDGLDPANVDLAGALSSSAITEADLTAGRWDHARVVLTARDWTAPEDDPLVLLEGELGSISVSDGRFSAELRGAASRLDRPACEETSPLCRATLGDKRCRVDLAGQRAFVRVVSASANVLILTGSHAANVYAMGSARWLSGRNSGLRMAIEASGDTMLTLAGLPEYPPLAGDLLLLTQGCDFRFETCVSRFGNGAQFQGEPHLPGHDLLNRYAIP